MKTDKEIYKIFKSYPKYLFNCAKINNRTAYSMESVTLKEFERRTDGILTPRKPTEPDHPMVAVFKPLFEKNIDTLKTNSKKWYQQISKSRLPKLAKKNLQNAFINWLLVRFPRHNYEEVIRMIETLPNVEETLAYQQLVGIGRKEGKQQGIKEGQRETLKQEMQRLIKMKNCGEIDDDVFKKICDPIRTELKKVTDEINQMLKEISEA